MTTTTKKTTAVRRMALMEYEYETLLAINASIKVDGNHLINQGKPYWRVLSCRGAVLYVANILLALFSDTLKMPQDTIGGSRQASTRCLYGSFVRSFGIHRRSPSIPSHSSFIWNDWPDFTTSLWGWGNHICDCRVMLDECTFFRNDLPIVTSSRFQIPNSLHGTQNIYCFCVWSATMKVRFS